MEGILSVSVELSSFSTVYDAAKDLMYVYSVIGSTVTAPFNDTTLKATQESTPSSIVDKYFNKLRKEGRV